MFMVGDAPTCPDCGSLRIPVRKGSSKLRCVNGCELLARAHAALQDELTQEAERLGLYDGEVSSGTPDKREAGEAEPAATEDDLASPPGTLAEDFDDGEKCGHCEEYADVCTEHSGSIFARDCEPDVWEEWSDAEFLDYVESHSKTPLALFHYDMILRFERLAGQRVPVAGVGATHLVAVPYAGIEDLLAKARGALQLR